MITVSKLALALAVAGPLAAATVSNCPPRLCRPVRSKLRRLHRRRRLTCSIGGMATVPYAYRPYGGYAYPYGGYTYWYPAYPYWDFNTWNTGNGYY